MKSRFWIAASAASLIMVSPLTSAQSPYPEGRPMTPPPMMMQKPMQRPPMPEFPSPQALARMAPPEPMTEEKIKQRFAKQLADLEERLERDRKAAEKYAKDFARLQKFRADRLAEIMADAEERRQGMVKRLKEQEQNILQRFREHQNGAKAADKPAASDS